MARDVAQRELDQAGLRIVNLGDPKQTGDATKTDNTNVPKANSGTGSPGTSLLAAPADHIHPASGSGAGSGQVSLDDPSQQSVTGTTEELVCEFLVNFSVLSSPRMSVGMTALVKVSAGTARFRVRLGGTPGATDGRELVGFSTVSPTFELGGASTDGVETPAGLALVKIVAATDRSDSLTHIRSKSVQFRGQS